MKSEKENFQFLYKKDIRITIRITAAELAKIEDGAKILAINKSRYIARMAAEGKIVDTYSPRQRALVISLIGIANNLNQMAKVAHTAGIMPIVAEIDELLVHIRKIIREGS